MEWDDVLQRINAVTNTATAAPRTAGVKWFHTTETRPRMPARLQACPSAVQHADLCTFAEHRSRTGISPRVHPLFMMKTEPLPECLVNLRQPTHAAVTSSCSSTKSSWTGAARWAKWRACLAAIAAPTCKRLHALHSEKGARPAHRRFLGRWTKRGL